MVFLTSIWWYLVLIGVMILIHELGHYWAARFFDVKVETFSFGFGPRLFGFKRGDTDFRFSLLLFGGYVKMAGDQPGDEATADPRNLLAKPRWQRLIITFAGPAINVVLAIALMTGLFMFHFPTTPPDPVVGTLDPSGAAAKAGIREGDQVVQIENVSDPNWRDIQIKELSSPNQPVKVAVRRGGERMRFTLTPVMDEKQGVGYLGWAPASEVHVSSVEAGLAASRAGLQAGDILVSANGLPLRSTVRLHQIEHDTDGKPLDLVYSRNGVERHLTITPEKRDPDGQGARWVIGLNLEPRIEYTKLPMREAFVESLHQNGEGAKVIFQFLERIVERRMSPKSIVGPVGIAQLSGEAAREGASIAYFGLMAMVSLNLAIVNLLPIPILDGGVILMLLIEMLMRRDLDLRMKEAVVKVGFVFLMVVVVFAIYNDISRMLPG